MRQRALFLILGLFLSVSLMASRALAVNYVTTTNTPFFSNPEKTQVFISTKTSVPKGTVVILHGMILVNFEIYADLIIDLTGKGYDVIFPQYQEAGFNILSSMGVLALLGGDSPSHVEWTQNAIGGINWALNKRMTYPRSLFKWVTRTPSQNLYIFAHSVGGAIGYNIPYLSSTLGGRVKGIVLANSVLDPSVLAQQTMPAGISMPEVELIDVVSAGQYVTMPLLFLTGSEDEWGTLDQGALFYVHAATADKKMLTAIGDKANHMAPATNQGPLFDLLSLTGLTKTMLGGDAEWNYLDTNYYEAAILHLIQNKRAVDFNPAIQWQ